jgi:L-ascorbate metabolism protein UlaG (beta-lactamase superfamily)
VSLPTLEGPLLPLPATRSGQVASTALWWVGQAGFLVQGPRLRFLVDPYLSDSLAEKYRGSERPHVRMRPSPVDPAALRDIDVVFATHGHTDHLDPQTVGPIAKANPGCLFVVPGSCADTAVARGVPADRLVEAQAFGSFEVAGMRVHAVPSAHEELAIDDHGRILALGYVIEAEGGTIYHSGDCAPYAGLAGNLARFRIDLGLLPVNGRDAVRKAKGVPGNFTLEEALDLAKRCGFGATIAHHFGMFDFNTIDLSAARLFLATRGKEQAFVLAEEGRAYSLDTVAAARGSRR